MSKYALFGIAGAFYSVLVLYVAAELYYNHTYWRLVLRKRRRHRWEFLLWLLRSLIIAIGVCVILIAVLNI